MARALERWIAPYIHQSASATLATYATSDAAQRLFVGRNVAEVANVAEMASEQPSHGWGNAEEERSAVIEHDGGVPREWAEALARLDPADPPGDVPPKRWVRFIDDCGRFVDDGWASCAEALGWGPLELFGCDRHKPYARIDHAGLLWLLNGQKLLALSANAAAISTTSGGRPALSSPSQCTRSGIGMGGCAVKANDSPLNLSPAAERMRRHRQRRRDGTALPNDRVIRNRS